MSLKRECQFDFVASTGRTATTYITSVLDGLDGVAACHEGYRGVDKDNKALLPLINLENAQAYGSEAAAERVVREKRNPQIIQDALAVTGQDRLVDVAYYNPMIAAELLAQLPDCRMVGIIRDCESFVRSSTTVAAEDPLPVGWPDPAKELTDREKFIGMGRIRPGRGSDEKALWKDWGGVRRNIWLWHETNLRLCSVKKASPDRVSLIRFDTFRLDPDRFWRQMAWVLKLPHTPTIPQKDMSKAINKKPFGYEIGPASDWSEPEKSALHEAQSDINERADYDC